MNSTLLSFPQRVYKMLKLCEQQGWDDIISWVNDGTAFKVFDLDEFERDLLPRYFNTKKYYTFTRALHAYGFTCARTGRQPGIYSHPRFKRSDPLGPSSMRRLKRKESRKAAAPNHTVPNTFIKKFSNRQSRIRPNPRAGVLNSQQICQFPSLLNEPRSQDNDSTATVFGRLYHTIASQVADRVASVPVHRIPSEPEVARIVDGESGSMDAGSYPNPSSTSTTKSALGDSPFILGNGDDMAPIVSSSCKVVIGSEQDHKSSQIPRHAPTEHNRVQERNDLHQTLHNQIPPGSELAGVFDGEDQSMGKRSCPASTSSPKPPFAQAVARSSGTVNDSPKCGRKLITRNDSSLYALAIAGHIRLQEQNDPCRIFSNLPTTKSNRASNLAFKQCTDTTSILNFIESMRTKEEKWGN